MNNQTILVGVGLLVLLGVGGWLWIGSSQPKTVPAANTLPDTMQPRAAIHTLAFENGKLTPNTLSVVEGNQITIRVTADEKGEFHVSGYEIENFMPIPGEALEFSFQADKPGRYNLEWHPGDTAEAASAAEDIVIGALVVNPR